jgi:prepilin signal peptidase PulO-like enzyme (type II secretory pathway)
MTLDELNLCVFGGMMAVNTATDIRRMEVSDRAILFAGLFCLGMRLMGAVEQPQLLTQTLMGAALAFLIGILLFFGGMGFGDVKLITVMGAFLGISLCIFALTCASVIGAVYALVYLKLIKKKRLTTELPFVPFLAIGSAVAIANSKIWEGLFL